MDDHIAFGFSTSLISHCLKGVAERGTIEKPITTSPLESDKSIEWIRLPDQFFHYLAAQKGVFARGETLEHPSHSYRTARTIANTEDSTL
jgi:hypothetical protein